MGLSELNWWIFEAKGFANKIWKLWQSAKPPHEFGKRSWDDFMNFKKDLIQGTQATIEGVNFIVTQVMTSLKKKESGWKRKALALGVSLITVKDCRKALVKESMKIMEKTPEALLWMAATEFQFKDDVPCMNLDMAYRNVYYYLDACVNSRDTVYTDAAKTVGKAIDAINCLCRDRGFQRRQITRCGCACKCTQSIEPTLIHLGLVNHDDVNGVNASHPTPNVHQICSGSQKLNSCIKSCKDGESEQDTLTMVLEQFCSRHMNWDPSKVSVAKEAPAQAPTQSSREGTTKAGTTSLEATFYYILLNVYMVI